MSFIQWESGRAKELARQELRDAREQLLKSAQSKFQYQEQIELKKKFRGDDQWMLPSLSQKIDKQTEKEDGRSGRKSKKEKKSKKKKKEKKHKKRKDSSGSESSEEAVLPTKKHRKRHYSSDSDEWVEKGNGGDKSSSATKGDTTAPLQRDNWMSGILIPTYTKKVIQKKESEPSAIDSYNPSTSTRELNPFWKDGGTGLPTFKKPSNESDNESDRVYPFGKQSTSLGNWRKDKTSKYTSKLTDGQLKDISVTSERHRNAPISTTKNRTRRTSSSSSSPDEEVADKVVESSKSLTADFLTDQQMNEMAAKIIKAEIMDDTDLVQDLKNRLNRARQYRDSHANDVRKNLADAMLAKKNVGDDILLTTTSENGMSKPLVRRTADRYQKDDPWGGRSSKKKQPKVQTHAAGERVRYFADDDKYDIKEMFENEKFTSGRDQDEQFIDIAGKHKNPNDDLEDIFSEHIVKGISESDVDEKNKHRSMHQHKKMQEALDTCDKCFGSPKMDKKLIVSMGTNVYLSLPWHEGLQAGHCMIVPMQHVSCATQLDEDVWTEVLDFQKALTAMFRSRAEDVIFFETVRYLHKLPHMLVHCIPSRHFELAPFYFKKAIQESEREWSTNKQLVTLKEKDLRRSIPRGLPYFWVHFGTEQGFAHVIEEQDRFSNNFAQEIIGGLLNLDVRKWMRPRIEQNPIPKVKQFADWWKPFDITKVE